MFKQSKPHPSCFLVQIQYKSSRPSIQQWIFLTGLLRRYFSLNCEFGNSIWYLCPLINRCEKFTCEHCTIQTIHLGPVMMMMVVVMIKMIVITIVSSVLFEGDIPSWQRGGQYPSCHFFTPHDNHDVDDNLIKSWWHCCCHQMSDQTQTYIDAYEKISGQVNMILDQIGWSLKYHLFQWEWILWHCGVGLSKKAKGWSHQ